MVIIDLRTRDSAEAGIVASARAGDLGAFALLYEQHADAILRQCRRALVHGDEAADAMQDTFLRAWCSLGDVQDVHRFGPWLRTIARHVCTDVIRRRMRTVLVEELDDTPSDEHQPEPVLTAAERASLTAAWRRLSERHRHVLWLREYAGWTYERIAADQRLEIGAVKSLLWRARQSLRREFLDLTEPDGGHAIVQDVVG
jgi:RNA polymerase sigma factor (sigma-70 family)